MSYAVVKIGSSQYRVSKGDIINVEKIDLDEGKKLKFEEVLLVVEDGKVWVGQPVVKGASVAAVVVKQFRGPKIRVATYKAKSRYRRVIGHRKALTEIKIDKISNLSVKKKSS